MQAARIKIGEQFAIKKYIGADDGFITMMVTEQVSVKDGRGTTNYFNGWYAADDGERFALEKVPAERFIAPVAEHEAALAQQQARREAAQKVRDDQKAMQMKAINLLANAIGAQAVEDKYAKGVDREGPYVAALYTSVIEINEAAWPALIEFLEKRSRRS